MGHARPYHRGGAEGKAKRDQYSKQCEATGSARVWLRPTRWRRSRCCRAAVRSATPCRRRSRFPRTAARHLDSVAAVFEKEGVSLAELGRSRPLAEQLVIHAGGSSAFRRRAGETAAAGHVPRAAEGAARRPATPRHEPASRAARRRRSNSRPRRKTRQDNIDRSAEQKHAPWSSDELKKLLRARGLRHRWKDVASRGRSRTWSQCKGQYSNLKKAGRLEPISEDTSLREKIWPGEAPSKSSPSARQRLMASALPRWASSRSRPRYFQRGEQALPPTLTGQTPSHAVHGRAVESEGHRGDRVLAASARAQRCRSGRRLGRGPGGAHRRRSSNQIILKPGRIFPDSCLRKISGGPTDPCVWMEMT